MLAASGVALPMGTGAGLPGSELLLPPLLLATDAGATGRTPTTTGSSSSSLLLLSSELALRTGGDPGKGGA